MVHVVFAGEGVQPEQRFGGVDPGSGYAGEGETAVEEVHRRWTGSGVDVGVEAAEGDGEGGIEQVRLLAGVGQQVAGDWRGPSGVCIQVRRVLWHRVYDEGGDA